MSYIEEMGFDGYDVPEFVNNEDNWKNGYHVTQDEKKVLLKDMTKEHLKATIGYFKNSDTKPLLEELNKRD